MNPLVIPGQKTCAGLDPVSGMTICRERNSIDLKETMHL